MEEILLTGRILFAILSFGAVIAFALLILDARKDVQATEWARVNSPRMYRKADAVHARDVLRNNWYRLASVVFLSLVASILIFTGEPRPAWLVLVLYVFVLAIPLTLTINAVQERRSRQSLRQRFRKQNNER